MGRGEEAMVMGSWLGGLCRSGGGGVSIYHLFL